MQVEKFLEKCQWEPDWARDHNICARTSARHRNRPNGLPYIEWAGKIWIPIAEGEQYLASLVKRRNVRQGKKSSPRSRARAMETISTP